MGLLICYMHDHNRSMPNYFAIREPKMKPTEEKVECHYCKVDKVEANKNGFSGQFYNKKWFCSRSCVENYMEDNKFEESPFWQDFK